MPQKTRHVILDFQALHSTAPSAVDELVRVLFKELDVQAVHVEYAPRRATELMNRFARHYRASERISFSNTRNSASLSTREAD